MSKEVYPFDTIEHQSTKKPYGFVDFDPNFFDVYLEKRYKNMAFLAKGISQFSSVEEKDYYSILELEKLKKFDTSKVIRTIYHELIKNGKLEEITLNHFWNILKKADLRKLTGAYDANFKNIKSPLGLENHALLAITLGMYAQTENNGYLQALSTSLKRNDFLVSRIDKLQNSLERFLTLFSLGLERNQVMKLKDRVMGMPLVEVPSFEYDKIEPPIVVEKLGMLLQEGNRSKAYLQALVNSGLYPNFTLLLRDSNHNENLDEVPQRKKDLLFDPGLSEIEILEREGILYKLIEAPSCNSPNTLEELEKRTEEFFVFSGRGILKEVLDVGKKIIHTHPGKLPDYRGSTCHIYSVLSEGELHCTSFIMKQEIDQGDIITSRRFPLPGRNIDAARIYDPYTRSMVIIDTVRQLAETGELKTTPQDLSKGLDYFIIHPVLENIREGYLDTI